MGHPKLGFHIFRPSKRPSFPAMAAPFHQGTKGQPEEQLGRSPRVSLWMTWHVGIHGNALLDVSNCLMLESGANYFFFSHVWSPFPLLTSTTINTWGWRLRFDFEVAEMCIVSSFLLHCWQHSCKNTRFRPVLCQAMSGNPKKIHPKNANFPRGDVGIRVTVTQPNGWKFFMNSNITMENPPLVDALPNATQRGGISNQQHVSPSRKGCHVLG